MVHSFKPVLRRSSRHNLDNLSTRTDCRPYLAVWHVIFVCVSPVDPLLSWNRVWFGVQRCFWTHAAHVLFHVTLRPTICLAARKGLGGLHVTRKRRVWG